tara:strand:- start:6011 stop:6265 length:255 start_codon:yes stop_codon:yes gene_type:complete
LVGVFVGSLEGNPVVGPSVGNLVGNLVGYGDGFFVGYSVGFLPIITLFVDGVVVTLLCSAYNIGKHNGIAASKKNFTICISTIG